jgi:hypothetical protein
MKARNVQLVPPSDPAYRAFCAEQSLASVRLRDKLAPSDAQLLSGGLESAFETWLQREFETDERRIIGYDLFNAGRNRYVPSYREVDALWWPQEDQCVVLEFKASGNPRSVAKAENQLRKSSAILACRFAVPKCVVVWCDTGEGASEDDLEIIDLPSLQAALSDLPPETSAFRISADELWRWAESVGLLSDPELKQRVATEAKERAELRDRRKALIDEGVPEEEWPEELTPPRVETPETYTLSFGEGEDDNPFAAALRKAVGGKGGDSGSD